MAFTLVSSLISFSRSKLARKLDLFYLGLKWATRKELIPISTRMTVSDPNAKLKRVSLVFECAIVLITQKVLGNSSTHKLLTSSSLFFKDSKIFLLVDFTCPLVCGWQMDERLKAICRLLQNYAILSLFNWNPLSMTIRWGTSNRHTMLSHRNFSTLFYVIVATASTSTHFVKYLHATLKNFFYTLASGKGLKISNSHWVNGLGVTILDSCSKSWCVVLANL